MKELDLSLYNKNFFDEIDKKWGIVVSGNKDISCNGMTVSWGGIGVIWNKKVCYLFVRKSRYTHDFFDKTKNCSISFLSDDYKNAKALFGSKSGRDLDKFKEANIHPEYDESLDTYYVAEADDVFLLSVLYKTDLSIDELDQKLVDRFYPTKDIHTMYVCEIKKYLKR